MLWIEVEVDLYDCIVNSQLSGRVELSFCFVPRVLTTGKTGTSILICSETNVDNIILLRRQSIIGFVE